MSQSPTRLPAWRALGEQFRALSDVTMRDLFTADAQRFSKMTLSCGDLLLDFSKNRVTYATMDCLRHLAVEAGVAQHIEDMFAGAPINTSERRAALHVALRRPANAPLTAANGVDVVPEVQSVLARMTAFASAVRCGEYTGATGKRITDVVNIGIGGSDLGPLMVTRALAPYQAPHLKTHFVSNVDGSHLCETVKSLTWETTLFIVSSKTFTTIETMTNARSARAWVQEKAGAARVATAVAKHFVAVSTNRDEVSKFGIPLGSMFPFWDWVGGRFSLWSAIGLAIAIAVGSERFTELLSGAHEIDEHFRRAPFERNIPVTMAMLGIWYRNFFGAATHAVLPYDQYLESFPAYLQQLDMESNGKGVDHSGAPVVTGTAPVVWGAPGTNGQHAFFQLLHQGTDLVPCDFIVAAETHNPIGNHHDQLVANCLAQAQALMRGKTLAEAEAELRASGCDAATVARLAPHKHFPGNRPSNTIFLRKLTPTTLGQLIAIYEHKVFIQGVIWGINSFDQWGVELGKKLASDILETMATGRSSPSHMDSSTAGLLSYYQAHRLKTLATEHG